MPLYSLEHGGTKHVSSSASRHHAEKRISTGNITIPMNPRGEEPRERGFAGMSNSCRISNHHIKNERKKYQIVLANSVRLRTTRRMEEEKCITEHQNRCS